MKLLKLRILLLLLFSTFAATATEKKFTLLSPDKKIRSEIRVDTTIQYSVFYNSAAYLLPSTIWMTLQSGVVIGSNPSVLKSSTKNVNQIVEPLYGISSSLIENYNELSIDFKGNYRVVFRAYNEGIAYRFETSYKDSLIIQSEKSDFHFAENYPVYFHPQLSEADYRLQKISDIQNPNYSSLPVLVKPANGINILLHESSVFNYPCLTVSASPDQSNTLSGMHAKYPIKAIPGGNSNFNLVVKEEENYIAKTTGTRTFPWRIMAFAENDGAILTNQLVYLLAEKGKLEDQSWIKPGKVAWDWWNANNLTGVPFKTGFNTETYKYFIDFAAKNKISYVNLDEGWSDQFNLLKVTDKLDMPELMRYAKEKNVGIILWCVWHTLDKQMNDALRQFEQWGIAGLKVDFMDRDDQVVVEFQERLLKEAAKKKMLVNYHGVYHPNGMQRTYPNNINNEGVKGLEWDKFSDGVGPVHDVTIPFIRMFAGSMDYTPGAMNNYNKKDWKAVFDRPSSQGTRCHQLAMYAVYYAPLQMISDAPTAYEKEPQILHYITAMPTTWDETVPLQNKVGEYVAVARRKGTSWYVGAMTNWDAKTLDISLNFLENNSYNAAIYSDGANADRVGSDYRYSSQTVSKKDTLKAEMAPGGGWAAIFTKQ